MARAPVVLNVYNMYWLNEYTSPIGLGVYHSGVEIYGKEYAFGGHPFDFTGIFDMEPRDVEDLGDGFSFKESIAIGLTDFNERDIKKMVEMLGEKFVGASYHLVKNNCNHFTAEFTKMLCGKSIPNWVNRLATIGIRFPFLCACIPKEWLTPDIGSLDEHDGNDYEEWEQIDFPVEEGPDSAEGESKRRSKSNASLRRTEELLRQQASILEPSCSSSSWSSNGGATNHDQTNSPFTSKHVIHHPSGSSGASTSSDV